MAETMERHHLDQYREHFPHHQEVLYSDHEIFLRELCGNAVDATQSFANWPPLGSSMASWANFIEVSFDSRKE